ncbi:MAG: ABC transporter permease, partial [Sporomusa sp.]
LIGGAIGFFNGVSVAKLGLSPFITTLAVMSMARGLAMAYTNGKTIYNLSDSFNFIGNGSVLGLPIPVILTGILFVIAHVILSRTIFGHQIYAIGGNREAAYLAGIDVKKIEIIVYSLAGCLYGVAAMILTGRLGVALPTVGNGLEMNALAAIVIGGASLYGGKGNMVGTLFGVIIIGVLNNGLNLLNVSPYWTLFIQGFVIFIALLIDVINKKKAK